MNQTGIGFLNVTPQQAQEIVDRYTKMWPFSRLTQEQMKEIEEAYKILKQKGLEDLGESPF